MAESKVFVSGGHNCYILNDDREEEYGCRRPALKEHEKPYMGHFPNEPKAPKGEPPPKELYLFVLESTR